MSFGSSEHSVIHDDPVDDVLAGVPEDAHPAERETIAWSILHQYRIPITISLLSAVGAYLLPTA